MAVWGGVWMCAEGPVKGWKNKSNSQPASSRPARVSCPLLTAGSSRFFHCCSKGVRNSRERVK